VILKIGHQGDGLDATRRFSLVYYDLNTHCAHDYTRRDPAILCTKPLLHFNSPRCHLNAIPLLRKSSEMSTSEEAPLNPAGAEATDLERNSYNDDSNSILDSNDMLAMDTQKTKRDPPYILILYGLSFVTSVGGLGCALWDMESLLLRLSTRTARSTRGQDEKYFWGMQSIVVLVCFNQIPTVLSLPYMEGR
jgi:hypothetical protein